MEKVIKPELDTEASGSLSVTKGSPKDKTPSKEVVRLPEIGKKFMIEGQEYVVCYVNEGQHRFSSEPCSGMY